MSVLIETSVGNFVADLYCDERPLCSLNFLKLCKLKQFNFCLFHSVQKNLVAQTGDPTGTGRGGSSYFEHLYGEQARYFDAEKEPKISHTNRGLLSMVDNGSGQHGSQFFITLSDQLDYLDGKHTVFGYIAEGIDIIDRINETYCDKENRPFRNIRIHHTLILDDPFADNPKITYPQSPTHIANNQLGPPRLEEDEEIGEPEGLSPQHMEQLKADQEAKTHAQLLTLIGDLPDANIKPPDNVLFVCRLNPVTTAEDLEIIFSRFGEIRSCEVIREKRTGASLQYAFIEFEREEDCENAFFKMDKVVIDDRRIHVDFSQSVAKEWQRYRQNQQSGYVPRNLERSGALNSNHSSRDKRSQPESSSHPSSVSHHHSRNSRSSSGRVHRDRRDFSPRKRNYHDHSGYDHRPTRPGASHRRRSPSPVERKRPAVPDSRPDEKRPQYMGDEYDVVVSDDESDSSTSSDTAIHSKSSKKGSDSQPNDSKNCRKSHHHHHDHHKKSKKKKKKHVHKHEKH